MMHILMCSCKRGDFMYRWYLRCIVVLMMLAVVAPFLYYSNIDTTQAIRLSEINYQKKLDISGVIQSAETTSINLSYPVYIKDVYVQENNYVNKGQLLFTTDTEKMEELLSKYNSATYASAGISFDKTSMLYIDTDKIYATESGVIYDISSADSFIMAEDTLCKIETSDNVMLKITLNQEDYSKVFVGDVIDFTPIIAPAKHYKAIVTDNTAVMRKETSLTGSKTVVDIYAQIDLSDDYLSRGMDCYGTLTNGNVQKIKTLPYDYVKQDDNGEFVHIYNENNNETHKVYIETGIETADYVQILTDFPSDTLFVKNSFKGKVLIDNGDN